MQKLLHGESGKENRPLEELPKHMPYYNQPEKVIWNVRILLRMFSEKCMAFGILEAQEAKTLVTITEFR